MNNKILEKKLNDIAQRAECVCCGSDIECPKCKAKMMDEHLWIPLSELNNILEEFGF